MTTTNSRINVSELDFDEIKTSIKEYLRGQSEFSDYDFEGSGLSVLLDVLAYNTHYNSIYANLAVNEMFLDSASKRSSVVSLAKNLGYIPQSKRSATALVNVVVNNVIGSPGTLTLPQYSEFITTIDGQTYTFYNLSDITTTSIGGVYTFSNVEIKEGTLQTFKYNVTNNSRFIIPNSGCDLSTLTVKIQENASSSIFETFVFGDEFTEIDAVSRAYFVKEIEDELYEVYFGDNIIGRAPANGNIVTLEYFVTNGSDANSARLFSFNGVISGGTVTVTTVEVAGGGSDIEDIDSVKYNAVRNFSSQNRAVTAEDYRVLLPKLYSNVESISVWGGEDNIPPIFGKVFVSIKPKTGETLTNSTKEQIKNEILKRKNVVSIIPEIVDPEYLYIKIKSTIYYNPQITTKTADTLKALVRQTIENYNTNELERFGGVFRYSRLSRLIDQTDPAILSNITTVELEKYITPSFNTTKKYIVYLDNPIYASGVAEESILTSGFTIPNSNLTYYIDDDGAGNLRLFYYVTSTTKSFVNTNFGSVNYSTGIITVNALEITSAPDNLLIFFIKPQSNDVVSVRNQLAYIRPEDTEVNAVVDRVASGETSSGTGYVFTSSRT